MKVEIVRCPDSEEATVEQLTDLAPYIDAMWTDNDIAIHGELDFAMDMWLFLWQSGHGLYLKLTEGSLIVGVVIATLSTCLWSGKTRLDIHRYVVKDGDVAILTNLTDYLINNASLLGFDELYLSKRSLEGHEIKELIWRTH